MTEQKTWDMILNKYGPTGVKLDWHGMMVACRTENMREENFQKCWSALCVMYNKDMGPFTFDPNMEYYDFVKKGGIVTFYSY